MAHTLTDPRDATPRERLAGVSGKPAKAELRTQVGATPLRDVVAEALRRATSQKAAALEIAISEGRLSHKLKDGSLTVAQLEELGAIFGMRLGETCREMYGTEDPQERIRRAIREARQKIDELAEAL